MNKRSFNIEFNFSEKCLETRRMKVFRYSASIIEISKNFGLFKVSKIRKTHNTRIVKISENYIVTSYPLIKNDDLKWKDASNFTSNMFLETIGTAIDSHFL